MTGLEELFQAVVAAPDSRRAEALRILRGETAAAVPAPPPPEPYLTLKEVAAQLRFSTDSLWLWKIPGHDLGGRRRFKLSEVAAYLESEEFKRRAAALRAERKLSAREAPKRPTPTADRTSPGDRQQ